MALKKSYAKFKNHLFGISVCAAVIALCLITPCITPAVLCDENPPRSVKLNNNNMWRMARVNEPKYNTQLQNLAKRDNTQLLESIAYYSEITPDKLRQINPNIKVYQTYDLCVKNKWDSDWNFGSPRSDISILQTPLGYSDIAAHDWWLRDGNGNIVNENSGTCFLDVGKPGFKELFLSTLLTRLEGRGYDGVWFDYWFPTLSLISDFSGGTAAFSGYSTDREWFDNAWQPFITYVMNGLHNAGYRVIGNCGGEYEGPEAPNPNDPIPDRYFRKTQRSLVDGTAYEQGAVDWWANGSGWLKGREIKRRIDSVSDDPLEVWVADGGLRNKFDNGAEVPNLEQKRLVSLAYYYIAIPTATQERHSYHHAYNWTAYWYPLWDFYIGTPQEERVQIYKDDVGKYAWSRKYTEGIVLLNYGELPGSTEEIIFTLDKEYIDPAGAIRSGAITLPAHTALILKIAPPSSPISAPRSVKLNNYNNWGGINHYQDTRDGTYDYKVNTLAKRDRVGMTEGYTYGSHITPGVLRSKNPGIKVYQLYDLNCKSRWESDGWWAEGYADGANSATQIEDTGVSWLNNQWKDRYVKIIKGRGWGQIKKIGSNTRNIITLADGQAFDTVPDNTSYYAVIYNNLDILQTPLYSEEINDNDWYLRDGNGNIVYEVGSSVGGNVMYLDVGKTDFREAFLQNLLSRLQRIDNERFDGVVFDYWYPGISWILKGAPRPSAYPTDDVWFEIAWKPFIEYVMAGLHNAGYQIIGNCVGEYNTTNPGQAWQRTQVNGTVYEQWVVDWNGDWLSGADIEGRINAFKSDPLEAWAADFGLRSDDYSFSIPVPDAAMLYWSTPLSQIAQTFKMYHHNITRISILLKKAGTGGSGLIFRIYRVNDDETWALVNGGEVTKGQDFISETSENGAVVDVDFNVDIDLTRTAETREDRKYILTMEQAGGDSANYVAAGIRPNANGSGFYMEDDGNGWIEHKDEDMVITVYSHEYQQKADLGLAMYYIALPDDAGLREKRFYHHFKDSEVFWEPLWDFYIGEPQEPAVKLSNKYFWSRKFTEGIVLFNYEPSEIIFSLDNEYVDPEGNVVDGSVPVPAHSAKILRLTNIGPDNSPPVLDPIGSKAVDENQALIFTVSANDPNGDALSYLPTALPLGASLIDNGDGTAVFSWTPTYTQAKQEPYQVTFTVTDGEFPISETITITVNDVNPPPANLPPVFPPIGPINIDEGVFSEISFSGSAYDPEGYGLIFGIENMPEGAEFDARDGLLSWKPRYDQAGEYRILISASDGVNPPVTQEVVITVLESSNKPPIIEPIGDKSVPEGRRLFFTVNAYDPNGDPVTCSVLSILPEGASFKPSDNEFEWLPNYEQAGEYHLVFAASDAEFTTTQEITITVIDREKRGGGPENTLVVVNDASPESLEVGSYYALRRGIPESNIVHITTTTGLLISYADYEAQIRDPIRQYLESHGLKDKILYIVTTYGIPYKLNDPAYADKYSSTFSVDTYLADLYDSMYNWISYPYRSVFLNLEMQTQYTGEHGAGKFFDNSYGIYLVTRLDGPSAKIAKGLVDKAIYAGVYLGPRENEVGFMSGQWYLQDAINTLSEPVLRAGYQCFPDPDHTGGSVATWYSSPGNEYYNVYGEWRPGAVGMHFQSSTAVRTIRDTETALVVPALLAADVTGTFGVVAEPYATGVPQPVAFFDYFLNGNHDLGIAHFNLAESFYLSAQNVKWRWFVVGDPLYILPENASQDTEPPLVENVACAREGNNVTISWNNYNSTGGSPEVTYGGVEYGTSLSYGNESWDTSPLTYYPDAKRNYLSQHTITITGLDPATKYYLRIKAIDPANNTTYKEIAVYPEGENQQPIIGAQADKAINEGEALALIISANDPEGDSLVFSVAGLPEGAIFNDNGDGTATFSWTPTYDQGRIEPYQATFTVTDSHGLSDSTTTAITVNDAPNPGQPPDISPIPDTLTKNEGDVITSSEIELATDPDGDALTYTYSGWFTSLPYAIDYTASGPHTVHIEVSDGSHSRAKDVTIKVNNVEVDAEPRSVRLNNYNNWAMLTVSDADYAVKVDNLAKRDRVNMGENYAHWAQLTPDVLKNKNPNIKVYQRYVLNCKVKHESDGWHAQGYANGTNSATKLQDTNATWLTNQWRGKYIKIVKGTGAGQVKRISWKDDANTENTITLDTGQSFDPIPDSSSYYAVIYYNLDLLNVPLYTEKINDPNNIRGGEFLGETYSNADDWYLRDGSGKIVYEVGTAVGGNVRYLDVGKEGFKEEFLANLLARLEGKGYDGVVFDYWWSTLSWLLKGALRPPTYPTDADWFNNAWKPFISYVMNGMENGEHVTMGLRDLGYEVIGNCAGEYNTTNPGQEWQRSQVDGTIYEQWVVNWDGDWLDPAIIERRINAFKSDDLEAWTADFGLRSDDGSFTIQDWKAYDSSTTLNKVGQSFQLYHHNITKINVLLKKVGRGSNELKFTINKFDDNGVLSPISGGQVTKDSYFISGLGEKTNVELDFGNLVVEPSALSFGEYVLVMEQTGADPDNYIGVWRALNANGSGIYMENDGSDWIEDEARDMIITVYSHEYQQKADLGLAMYYIALPDNAVSREKRFYHHYKDMSIYWEPLWDFYIGEPREPAVKLPNEYFWSRKFTEGIVLMNYESAETTFPLDQEYVDLYNETYGKTEPRSVNIPAHSAKILRLKDPVPDTTPPVITNVTASNITQNTATITWDTDEPATSKVEYGIASYDTPTPEDTSLVTSHSVSLAGLNPNTTYNYRVISKDGSANPAIGDGLTFTTSALADTEPPTGTISINNGDTYTASSAVTLSLTAEDSGSGMAAGEMKISNIDSGWDGVVPEPYATTKTWTLLSGNGPKTVYVKYKDAAGNWMPNAVFDSIDVNQPPDISPIPDTLTKNEGDVITNSEIELATDPDGDALTYAYSGWLTSLPYTITYDDAGTYTLHVEVSDGSQSRAKDVTITVNSAPVLAVIGDKSVNEVEFLSFIISATDADNDALSYSATDGPFAAGAGFDPATRTFSWIPDYTQSGSHTVTFIVDDKKGGVDSETVSIIVNDIEVHPEPQSPIFPHIKTAATIWSSTNSGQKEWSKRHFDIALTGKEKINNTSLNYVSWSDFEPNRQEYDELHKKFDAAGLDFNDAFLHYSKDVYIPKSSKDPWSSTNQRVVSIKEDRFYKVIVPSGSIWVSGTDAKWGNGLEFDGTGGFVDLGKAINPKITCEVTFEAWIKPKSHIGSTIFGWSYKNAFWIDGSGMIAAEINVDGTRRTSPRYSIPAYDQWYHVVGVGDANLGVTRLYINGNEVGTASPYTPGNITDITGSLIIGASQAYSGFFQGVIDDVRIYNRALSEEEVQQRYADNAYITDGLAGYWNFDEGEGDTIHDMSGFGNHGLLYSKDITALAYGDSYDSNKPLPQDYNTAFCAKENEMLYIGHPWKSKEINFNLSQAAGSGWNGVWEYWDGSAWAGLTINDGTNNMQQSGKVAFVPPDNWSKTKVSSYNLYWLRLKCIAAGVPVPVFHSRIEVRDAYQWQGVSGISNQKYEIRQVNGVDSYLVPGWNPNNDRNQDGFVDDSEFASLADPSATARLKYQSLAPSWYFSNRWVTNFGNSAYVDYIADKSLENKVITGVAGLFVDNAGCSLPDSFWGGKTYLEYPGDPKNEYRRDAIAGLRAIKQKLGASLVITNTNDRPFYAPEIIEPIDGFWAEGMISYASSNYRDTPDNLSLQRDMIKSFAQAGKIVIVHGNPNPAYWDNPQLKALDPQEARGRDSLYALARYYLTAFDNTYFDYQDNSNYGHPWEDWFEGIAYDIGKPTGDFYILKTARDNYPETPPENIIFNPSFENGNDIPITPNSDYWMSWNWGEGTTNLCGISDVSKDGAHSLRIDARSDSQYVGVQYVYQRLKPNTAYTLSGWIKTENLELKDGKTLPAKLYLKPGPNTAIGTLGTMSIGVSNKTRDWTYVSTVIKTGDVVAGLDGDGHNGNARIYAINDGASGTAWFDDIKLEEGEYPLNYVYARNFTKALVLLKPMPNNSLSKDIGDDTAAILNLGAQYQPLNTDGTLGQATNRVDIKNFEGMILIKTDTTPPVITNITASNITQDTATITWDTDEPATSQVKYSIDTSYSTATQENLSLVTSHSVSLAGLNPNTTYYYRVISKDGSTNQAAGNGLSFTTSALADTEPPTGTISINNGDTYTASSAVTLSLMAEDPGSGMAAGEMKISNMDSGWDDVVAESYVTTRAWTLSSGGGQKTVYVKYKDAAGNWMSNAASDSITVNRAPVLDSIGNQTVDENQALTFSISAEDQDIGDTLTFTHPTAEELALIPGAVFTDNGGGAATFSWPPTYTQSGVYQVTFTVTDNHDESDSEPITITVNNVPGGGQPPDISSIPDTLTKNEGETITKEEIELATDPDGDTLTYTYSGWLTPLPYTITYDDAGTYILHVEVFDGNNPAIGKDIAVTVNDQNPSATITVDASMIGNKIPKDIVGNNLSWQGMDKTLNSDNATLRQNIVDLIEPLRIPLGRLNPGESLYRWWWTIGSMNNRREIGRYPGDPDPQKIKCGVDEYLRICEQLGIEDEIISVNYAAGAQEAANWVEYCNGIVPENPNPEWTTSSYTGDQAAQQGYFAWLRAQYGHPLPYAVKYWEIGNEVWWAHHERGPFPIDGFSATVYGNDVVNFAQKMKEIDPTIKIGVNVKEEIEIVANDLEWNRPVLEACASAIDFTSLHVYNSLNRLQQELFYSPRTAMARQVKVSASGNHTISVVAVGAETGTSNEPPVLELKIDDVFVKDWPISMGEIEPYDHNADLTSGNHKIELTFKPPDVDPITDSNRDLFVYRVLLDGKDVWYPKDTEQQLLFYDEQIKRDVFSKLKALSEIYSPDKEIEIMVTEGSGGSYEGEENYATTIPEFAPNHSLRMKSALWLSTFLNTMIREGIQHYCHWQALDDGGWGVIRYSLYDSEATLVSPAYYLLKMYRQYDGWDLINDPQVDSPEFSWQEGLPCPKSMPDPGNMPSVSWPPANIKHLDVLSAVSPDRSKLALILTNRSSKSINTIVNVQGFSDLASANAAQLCVLSLANRPPRLIGNLDLEFEAHNEIQIAGPVSIDPDNVGMRQVSVSILNKNKVEITLPSYSVTAIELILDNTPPTPPANLTARAISSSQVDLTWSASTDDTGVAGYKLYRNGVEIGTTAATSYSNTGLQEGTTYSYEVSAYDAAGNESAKAIAAQATTYLINNPTVPDGGSSAEPTSPQSGQQALPVIGYLIVEQPKQETAAANKLPDNASTVGSVTTDATSGVGVFDQEVRNESTERADQPETPYSEETPTYEKKQLHSGIEKSSSPSIFALAPLSKLRLVAEPYTELSPKVTFWKRLWSLLLKLIEWIAGIFLRC